MTPDRSVRSGDVAPETDVTDSALGIAPGSPLDRLRPERQRADGLCRLAITEPIGVSTQAHAVATAPVNVSRSLPIRRRTGS
jgi:hypothetical protein